MTWYIIVYYIVLLFILRILYVSKGYYKGYYTTTKRGTLKNGIGNYSGFYIRVSALHVGVSKNQGS